MTKYLVPILVRLYRRIIPLPYDLNKIILPTPPAILEGHKEFLQRSIPDKFYILEFRTLGQTLKVVSKVESWGVWIGEQENKDLILGEPHL